MWYQTFKIKNKQFVYLDVTFTTNTYVDIFIPVNHTGLTEPMKFLGFIVLASLLLAISLTEDIEG